MSASVLVPILDRPHVEPLGLGPLGLLGESTLGEMWGETPKARHRDIGKEKIGYIMKLMREGSRDAQVVTLARRIVQNERDKDWLGEARAVWQWLVDNVRYVRDPVGMEAIQTARRQLFPGELLPAHLAKRVPKAKPSGDCDEMGAVTAGALLMAIGFPVRVALWRKPPGPWQHIFVLAYLQDRKCWVPVDPTEKDKPFGWLPGKGRWTAYRFDDDAIQGETVCTNVQLGGQWGELDEATLAELGIGNFFKNIGKSVKNVASNVWDNVKGALPAVATAASSFIPGVGKVAAPLIGNLVNTLTNDGRPNPHINQVHQAMQQGQDPIQAVAGSVTGVPAIGRIASGVIGNWVPQLQQNPWVQQQERQQRDQELQREAMQRHQQRAYEQQQAQQQQFGPSPPPQHQQQQQLSPFQAAQQYGPPMGHASQRMAPQMAAQTMSEQPQVREMGPQAQEPSMWEPVFAAQAQRDFQQQPGAGQMRTMPHLQHDVFQPPPQMPQTPHVPRGAPHARGDDNLDGIDVGLMLAGICE